MTTYPDQYRLRPGMPGYWQTCESIGEHTGDAVVKDDAHGRWEHWKCCDTREFVGELADCDTCLEPGLTPEGADLPEGWVEDNNGAHCPRCQP